MAITTLILSTLLLLLLLPLASSQSCQTTTYKVPFNKTALASSPYSGVFECYRPRGALQLLVKPQRITKKLEEGCAYCIPCDLDEVHLLSRPWKNPIIEVRPGISDVFERYEQYEKLGKNCDKLRKVRGIKSRWVYPWGKTRAEFKKRMCELLELARKVRDFRCLDINTPVFKPVVLDKPMASVVNYLESVMFRYGY